MAEAADKWRMETDVVVVGYGGAGATAAITAHDNGARVTILEKMPAGGGNTRLAGGTFVNPAGLEAVQYIEALCFGTTERAIIEAFVEKAVKNNEWLRGIGGEVEPRPVVQVEALYPAIHQVSWPNVPGGELMSKYNVKRSQSEVEARQGSAVSLWRLLSTNVERRGITVMTGTPAKELSTNERGELVGVVAEKDSKKFLVKAKKAVILTCGGFEFNEAMKEAFLLCKPFYAFGNPGSTGDGIIMAQKLGAALWHMTAATGYFGFKVPEYEAAFPIRIHGERFIYVDRDGRRFFNETATNHRDGIDHHDVWRTVSIFDPSRLCFPRIPAYAIFDEVTRRRGPLFPGNTGVNQAYYKWSLDNSAEIARGWITQGETIREVARHISVDESSLENTVAKYNEFCKAGKDADFGRSKEGLGPIEQAPYYALRLWPCLLNTQGGPRRDKEARVLDTDGKPIPRLYSAGELGSLWGWLYQGAGNIAECLAFGRIAGRNAAAEKPWS